MAVVEVTEANFEQEVLRSDLPVLVDLNAVWCEPCKQLSPLVEEVATEFAGRLKVVKIDIDRNPGIAQAFRVQSVPTLAVIAGGQIASIQPGLIPKAKIIEMVRPHLPAEAGSLTPVEFASLLKAERAVPVDIRDAASYGRFRIPTAIHVPAEELASRTAELAATDGKMRVLYGRSTDLARESAEKLKETGVVVGFLDGGFLHWEAKGLEVERAF